MASVFISRYQLKPEKRDEFVRTLKAMYDGGKEFIAKETNFVFYGFGRDPNEFVAIESWKNEAVVNALRGSEEFKQGFAALMSCAAAPMEMEVFRSWDDDASVFEIYPRGASRVHPKVGDKATIFI
jgi:quinol monooxygenase YgiN